MFLFKIVNISQGTILGSCLQTVQYCWKQSAAIVYRRDTDDAWTVLSHHNLTQPLWYNVTNRNSIKTFVVYSEPKVYDRGSSINGTHDNNAFREALF